MKIHVIKTGVLSVNTLIVPFDFENSSDSDGKKCFVVDPAACALSNDEDKILKYLEKNKTECAGIVLTHSHFDHILGVQNLKSAFPNAKIFIHKDEENELGFCCGRMNSSILFFFGETQLMSEVSKQPPADVALKDGDEIFGWKTIHTPGHSPGSICLFNADKKILISGDTLFDYGGRGRTDMYGGDETLLMKSFEKLNREIPKGTLVYPGHDSFGFSF